MRYFTIALTAAALTAAATPAAAAVLVQYQFSGNTGTEASEAAINVATGLTGLSLVRGPGLAATAGANSLNSTGFSTDTANDYYGFGFTVGAGSTATVNQLIFGSQASGTGPGFINVLASVDNGAFTTVGSYALQASVNNSQTLTFATPLSALSRVEFRLVAANNTNANGDTGIGAAGTFRVTNFQPTGANTPFTIDGSVGRVIGAVPEPATWGMMVAGFGLVGGMLRRRSTAVRFA